MSIPRIRWRPPERTGLRSKDEVLNQGHIPGPRTEPPNEVDLDSHWNLHGHLPARHHDDGALPWLRTGKVWLRRQATLREQTHTL